MCGRLNGMKLNGPKGLKLDGLYTSKGPKVSRSEYHQYDCRQVTLKYFEAWINFSWTRKEVLKVGLLWKSERCHFDELVNKISVKLQNEPFQEFDAFAIKMMGQ